MGIFANYFGEKTYLNLSSDSTKQIIRPKTVVVPLVKIKKLNM